MSARYDLRKEAEAWAVYDVWTGETVVIAMVPQDGLDKRDAIELVDLLNNQVARGNRDIHQ